MAGQVTGGQTLTPNRDVYAPAGVGGSLWGANGGGITPCNTKSILQTLSDGETATNYLENSQLGVIQPGYLAETPGVIITLLHFDDGANTFIDSSSPALTWTATNTTGTATESATQFKFGSGSLYTSGYNAFISTPQTAGGPLDLTTGDFTIDCWIYPTTATQNNAITNGLSCIWDFSNNLLDFGRCYMDASGILNWQPFGAGNWSLSSMNSGVAVPLNAWNHIVFSRQGNVLYLGLNGVMVSHTVSANSVALSSPFVVLVGSSFPSAFQHIGWDQGYIDEFRVIKGQAIFAGATYTVPTAPSANPVPANVPIPPPPTISMLSAQANAALSGQTLDNTLAAGNSNAG